jgi:hypothetical protein
MLYGAAGIAALVVVAWLMLGGQTRDGATPAAETTADNSASALPVASTPAVAPSSAATASETAAAAASRTLLVKANAPLAEIRIGSRSIVVEPARAEVNVELSAEETATRQTVIGIAKGGQRSQATLAADSKQIALEFALGSTHTGHAPQPRPPPKNRPAPLAPSPYD